MDSSRQPASVQSSDGCRCAHALDDVMHTCAELEAMYRHALDAPFGLSYRVLFRSYAIERRGFIDQLRGELRAVGDVPWARGRECYRVFAYAMPRAGSALAVLAACEFGEDGGCHAYTAALASPLPESTHRVLTAQAQSMDSARHHLHALLCACA